MKTESQKRCRILIAAVWFAAGCWSLLSPSLVVAQVCPSTEGYNAVWGTKSPNCTTLEVVGSPAFIDASAWCGASGCDGVDFCSIVKQAILDNSAGFSTGLVVDARGVTYSLGGAETCTVNPFDTVNIPVTLLLPPETLKVLTTWILPNNTRVVGTGRLSQLRATVGFTPDPNNPVEAMIEMGNTSVCPSGCTGISIEHLKLDGNLLNVNGVGLTGIYNGSAKDGSYVDDVEFYQVGAVQGQSNSVLTTGLLIDTGASGSGPYSKITFSGVSATLCDDGLCGNNHHATCQPTAAVQIRAATRGLHSITSTAVADQANGVRCAGPQAGIYLDASSNSIEDAHFEGFYDGIVVGANINGQGAPVTGNVISNVNGGFGGNSGSMINMVHICSPQSPAGSACSSTSVSAKDLTILDTASVGSGALRMTTIKDDLTGTFVNSSASTTRVAMYSLGEPMGASYSRFTTSLGSTNGSSPVMPTWAVGNTALGTGTTSCSTPGALYSNTAGTGSGGSSNTLYICSQAGAWLLINNQ
jgi:hypothetical protein